MIEYNKIIITTIKEKIKFNRLRTINSIDTGIE